MKLIADMLHPRPLQFVIQSAIFRDARLGMLDLTGYYLYVYDNGRVVYDYLQDTLELAKDFALRKFNVPRDAWKEQN